MSSFLAWLKKKQCEHKPEELVRYMLTDGSYDVLYQCSKCGERNIEREIPEKKEREINT